MTNPAREALTRAVNKAIREGAPVFEEQPATPRVMIYIKDSTGHTTVAVNNTMAADIFMDRAYRAVRGQAGLDTAWGHRAMKEAEAVAKLVMAGDWQGVILRQVRFGPSKTTVEVSKH